MKNTWLVPHFPAMKKAYTGRALLSLLRIPAITAMLAGMICATNAEAFQVDKRIWTDSNQGWKSYGNTGGSPPPSDWASNLFDDSGWANARSPYPNPNLPQSLIPAAPCGLGCTPSQAQFMWHDPARTSDGTTGVNDAYFRKTFNLSVQADSLPLEAIAQIQADDDFEFFINGHSIFLNNDQGFANQVFNIDLTSYLLQNADNVIAIHAVDGGWGNPGNRGYEEVLMDARIRSVDEPSTMALIGLSLVGLSASLRKRRSRNAKLSNV